VLLQAHNGRLRARVSGRHQMKAACRQLRINIQTKSREGGAVSYLAASSEMNNSSSNNNNNNSDRDDTDSNNDTRPPSGRRRRRTTRTMTGEALLEARRLGGGCRWQLDRTRRRPEAARRLSPPARPLDDSLDACSGPISPLLLPS
jgi:hypothetical protein